MLKPIRSIISFQSSLASSFASRMKYKTGTFCGGSSLLASLSNDASLSTESPPEIGSAIPPAIPSVEITAENPLESSSSQLSQLSDFGLSSSELSSSDVPSTEFPSPELLPTFQASQSSGFELTNPVDFSFHADLSSQGDLFNPGEGDEPFLSLPPKSAKFKELLLEAKKVFVDEIRGGSQRAPAPQLQRIQQLRDLLEDFSIDDLGLTEEVLQANFRQCAEEQLATGCQKIISSWNIIQSEELSIALFLLPRGCPLELHSHPGMVVVSKILAGNLKARVVSAWDSKSSSRRSTIKKSFSKPLRGKMQPAGPFLSVLAEQDFIVDFGVLPGDSSNRSNPSHPPNQSNPSNLSHSPDGSIPSDGSNLSDASNPFETVNVNVSLSVHHNLVSSSRRRRHLGDKIQVVELFNGVVSSKVPEKIPEKKPTLASRSSVREISPPISSTVADPPTKSKSYNCPLIPLTEANLLPNPFHPTTLVATPCIGNLHRFEAATDFVVVLDVISPSYNSGIGRVIDYYTPTSAKSTTLCIRGCVYKVFQLVVADEQEVGPEGGVPFDPLLTWR